MVSGMNLDKFLCPTFLSILEVFIEDKQHRTSFPNDGCKHTTKPLKIVQLVVCVHIKDVVSMEDSRSTK